VRAPPSSTKSAERRIFDVEGNACVGGAGTERLIDDRRLRHIEIVIAVAVEAELQSGDVHAAYCDERGAPQGCYAISMCQRRATGKSSKVLCSVRRLADVAKGLQDRQNVFHVQVFLMPLRDASLSDGKPLTHVEFLPGARTA